MKIKIIIWALILILLGASSSSFFLRWNNEQNNLEVVTVADYQAFHQTIVHSNRNVDSVMRELRSAGIQAVGLREVSMRDLAEQGQIYLSTFGEFIGRVRTQDAELYEIIKAELPGFEHIGIESLVAISPDDDTTAFLYERLSARYLTPAQAPAANRMPEFFNFSFENNDYFITNMELASLPVWGQGNVLDVQLGFDTALMERLTEIGFSLALRPGTSTGSNDYFWAEYEAIIQRFNVQTIIFGTHVFNGTADCVERAHALIERHGIIVGIVETPHQVQYVGAIGLDPLMERLNFQVNRVYSTTNDEFVARTRDRYYRWVRAVIDRNIRFLYIHPFQNLRLSPATNLDDTIGTIADFYATIGGRGYSFTGSLTPLDTSMPSRVNRILIGLSLVAAGVLYLAYLFKLREIPTLVLLGTASVLCVGINLLPIEWSQVYALGAAVLYPSLSSLLMLIYFKSYRAHSFIRKLAFSLGIILLVNALGMFTVVASLADIRYIMNVEVYRGVIVALFLPLATFALNYIMVFKDEDNLFDMVYKLLMKSPTYLVMALGFIGLAVVYIFLTRSGNTPTFGVSQIELRIREFLETVFMARPRFKEILIGYPALLVMVYLYHRYKQNLLLLVLGFGVVIGSTSMLNSFCHVFTSINISAQRTFLGLLVGFAIALFALAGVVIIEWLFLKWYRKHKKPIREVVRNGL